MRMPNQVPNPMDLFVLAVFRAGNYTLIAVGFALVFGSCRILNLMHGTYVMLGAYATHIFVQALARSSGLESSPAVIASGVALAAASTGVVGFSFFKLLQLTRRTDPQQVLAISVAGNLFVAQVLQYLYGTEGLNVPPILGGSASIGGVTIPRSDVLIPPAAILTVAIVWLWLHRSRSGMALRAVADDPGAARLVGINPDRSLAGAVGIAALMAGLAGGLTAPSQALAPDMWIHPLLVSFAVVVFGGRGSLLGAVASACFVAFVETVTSWYWSEAAAQYVALILIVAGLFLLPSGLSGGPRHESR